MSITTTERRYNAVDPTGTTSERRSFQRAISDRWDAVGQQVIDWFDAYEDSSDINYSRLRFRFMDWFEHRCFDEVLEPTTEGELHYGKHWTGSYVRTAYRHGLDLAKGDLRATEFTEYTIKDAVNENKQTHTNAKEYEYENAYFGLRDQVHRIIDEVGGVLREGIEERSEPDEFVSAIQDRLESVAKNHGNAHANVIIVETVNEALLTAFERAGVEQVGAVAERTEAASTTQNIIRYNIEWWEKEGVDDELPDETDPRAPDTVEWVTAGDEKVCSDCEAIEGSVLQISRIRGNPQFHPPIHPNCRCRLIPIMPDGGVTNIVHNGITYRSNETDTEIARDEEGKFVEVDAETGEPVDAESPVVSETLDGASGQREVTGISNMAVRSRMAELSDEEVVAVAEDIDGISENDIQLYEGDEFLAELVEIRARAGDADVLEEHLGEGVAQYQYVHEGITEADMNPMTTEELSTSLAEYDIAVDESVANVDPYQRAAIAEVVETMPDEHLTMVDRIEEGGQVGQFDFEENTVRISSWTDGEAIESASYETNDPRHVVAHEFGHAAHYAHLSTEQVMELREEAPDSYHAPGEWDGHEAARDMNTQAGLNFSEFTAEVYAGSLLGMEYDDDVMETYDRWGGPRE